LETAPWRLEWIENFFLASVVCLKCETEHSWRLVNLRREREAEAKLIRIASKLPLRKKVK
jgi:hypothetical protein